MPTSQTAQCASCQTSWVAPCSWHRSAQQTSCRTFPRLVHQRPVLARWLFTGESGWCHIMNTPEPFQHSMPVCRATPANPVCLPGAVITHPMLRLQHTPTDPFNRSTSGGMFIAVIMSCDWLMVANPSSGIGLSGTVSYGSHQLEFTHVPRTTIPAATYRQGSALLCWLAPATACQCGCAELCRAKANHCSSPLHWWCCSVVPQVLLLHGAHPAAGPEQQLPEHQRQGAGLTVSAALLSQLYRLPEHQPPGSRRPRHRPGPSGRALPSIST